MTKYGVRLITQGIALSSLVVVLTGCGGGVDPTMDHEQARVQVASILDEVQVTVGGVWESSDWGAEECRLPSGGVGAKYLLTRSGPGVVESEQQGILDAVAAQWTALGYPPVTVVSYLSKDDLHVKVTELRYPQSGYDANGMYMTFGITVNSTDLQAYTQCVPGDADEINQQWWDEYNRQQEQLQQQGSTG